MIKEIQINKNKSNKNKNQQSSKKPLVLKVFISCLAILGVAQILICCWLAEDGNQLKKTEKEIAVIENENRLLQKEVAKFVSLSKVQNEALKQGFVYNPEILDLTSASSVALKN